MDGRDERHLAMMREALFDPFKEVEAKRELLDEIREQVLQARAEAGDRALNGGKLSRIEDEGDSDNFTYNAIRVLMARYMSRDAKGRFLETPAGVMARVADGITVKMGGLRDEIYRRLIEGRFMFNSPTLFNLYADGAKGTLSACYVTPVYDSMDGIMDAAEVQAMTFKWGGGQGFSFSNLRPRWSTVRGTSGYASGPMSFMRLYDSVTEMVKQGGKRRGANMGILHDWHVDLYTPGFDGWQALWNSLPPNVQGLLKATKIVIEQGEEQGATFDAGFKSDVERLSGSEGGWWSLDDAGFIQAKAPPLQDANLTNFNISVGVHDAFMKAVIEGEDWIMVDPRYSGEVSEGDYRIHYTVSRAYGLGGLDNVPEWIWKNDYLNVLEDEIDRALENIEKDGRRVSREKMPWGWVADARGLWDELVKAAWGGGDPGVVYFDNHNKWSPTPWLGVIVAVNPCSEQALYSFESCNLGSVSIDKYVHDGRFDLDKFAGDVGLYVRALDAVIDWGAHPDERQVKANAFTRKVGLGIMGLADALAGLGIPYDSDEGVAFTYVLMAALEVFAWKASWELGRDKGPAPAFTCRKFDWRTLECVDSASVSETLEVFMPALRKAEHVVKFSGGNLTVRYKENLVIPEEYLQKLNRFAGGRVSRDGSIRLFSVATLRKVLEKYFGVTMDDLDRAIDGAMDSKALLALAVWRPGEAWQRLVEYGREIGAKAPRNTVTTTIAPTGTISILAGTSSGIEPYFALVFKRQVAVGTFMEAVRRFRDDLLRLAERYGVGREMLERIYEEIERSKGSLRYSLGRIIDDIREEVDEGFIYGLGELARVYAVSFDVSSWYHVAHQVAAQIFVDQAISKTLNLPEHATVEVVESAYMLAWLGGLKGFTVYRDGSKGRQVIVFGGSEDGVQKRLVRVDGVKRSRIGRLAVPRKSDGGVVVGLTQNSECKTCEI